MDVVVLNISIGSSVKSSSYIEDDWHGKVIVKGLIRYLEMCF